MPRKNQRRKTANSQSGRRKPKPIKFNQNEIENEQKHLRASIEEDDDVVDDEQQNEQDGEQEGEQDGEQEGEQEQEQEQQPETLQQHQHHHHHQEQKEMELISGSATIQEDDENNKTILNEASNGNGTGTGNIDIDHTNQMDKIDDVKNDDDAAITIPVAYNNSFANCTFNCILNEEQQLLLYIICSPFFPSLYIHILFRFVLPPIELISVNFFFLLSHSTISPEFNLIRYLSFFFFLEIFLAPWPLQLQLLNVRF